MCFPGKITLVDVIVVDGMTKSILVVVHTCNNVSLRTRPSFKSVKNFKSILNSFFDLLPDLVSLRS